MLVSRRFRRMFFRSGRNKPSARRRLGGGAPPSRFSGRLAANGRPGPPPLWSAGPPAPWRAAMGAPGQSHVVMRGWSVTIKPPPRPPSPGGRAFSIPTTPPWTSLSFPSLPQIRLALLAQVALLPPTLFLFFVSALLRPVSLPHRLFNIHPWWTLEPWTYHRRPFFCLFPPRSPAPTNPPLACALD